MLVFFSTRPPDGPDSGGSSGGASRENGGRRSTARGACAPSSVGAGAGRIRDVGDNVGVGLGIEEEDEVGGRGGAASEVLADGADAGVEEEVVGEEKLCRRVDEGSGWPVSCRCLSVMKFVWLSDSESGGGRGAEGAPAWEAERRREISIG